MSAENEKDTSEQPPSLEMRVAAIEDKLSRITVTPEEMQAFQKVASLMAGRGITAAVLFPPFHCQISPILCVTFIPSPPIVPGIIPPIIVADCIQAGAGGPASGSGFEALGRG